MPDLADGETAEIQGSAADPYELKNVGGVYSCSCPAWRNQSRPIDRRTCKHLKQYRGEREELDRLGQEVPAAWNTAASTSASSSSGGGDDAPKVLLAHKWDNSSDLTGWWMSEKLDGVRAYWNGNQFLSRLGNVFRAPAWFVEGLPDSPLDGELWVGRQMFQETVSIVRRYDAGDHWQRVTYVVFDVPTMDAPFEDRYAHLAETYPEGRLHYTRFVEHFQCESVSHMQEELARVEALGGEGLMMRKPGSKYAKGRSNTLLKVKSFHDAEAKVIGHLDGSGKHAGRLGALRVELADGTEFSVGTGFSDAERESPPGVGSVITFRYQELTKAGVPRFPSFVGERVDAAWPAELPPKPVAPTQPEQAERPTPPPATARPPQRAPAPPVARTPPPPEKPPGVIRRFVSPDGEEIEIRVHEDTVTTVQEHEDEMKAEAEAAEMIKHLEEQEWTESTVKTGETRRLEFRLGQSAKFWEVTVEDKTMRIEYGRVGTDDGDARESSQEFPTQDEAIDAAERNIRKKLKKGYRAAVRAWTATPTPSESNDE